MATSSDSHSAGTQAHGGAPHSDVFPPFDTNHFSSQLLWLALTFGALYLLILASAWRGGQGKAGGSAADLGRLLFTSYSPLFLATGVLLLVASVGVVVLCRKDPES